MIWLVYLIGALLALILLKDLSSIFRYYRYYKQQGISLRYVPVFGMLRFFITTDKKDGMAAFRSLAQSMEKSQDLIAVNSLRTNITFFLKSGEIIKEFCEKDKEFCDRKLPLQLPIKIGFLLKSGKHTLKQRRIFSHFFIQKHLDKITPMIEKITIQKLELVKKELLRLSGGDSKIFQKVNLLEYWKDLFSELINSIMFGVDDSPKVDGMSIPNAVQYLIHKTTTEINNHPLNLLFLMIPAKLGLLPQYKPLKLLKGKIEKACLEMYKKRTRLSPRKRSCNLVDLMVEHNLNCPEDEILSEEMIIGNLFLFQTAGMDTSRQASITTIHHLSKNPDLSSKLPSEVMKDLFKNGRKSIIGDLESLDQSPFLNNFLTEALRIFGPVGLCFPRVAKKDLKLGNYKIYKGDGLIVPLALPHFDPEKFDNPNKFKVDRLADSRTLANATRSGSYLPFSSGNRGCIGKYLAQIFLKVGLSYFIKEFEVAEVQGFDPKMEFSFTYGVKDCWVKLRPRNTGTVGQNDSD